MSKKIVIVGGVAGGASAAARLRRRSEEDQIIMFEKGPHVSFSNCSLPYHLSGIIQEADDLVLMNPELFLSQYRIEARTLSEVIGINKEAKEIEVRNLQTGEVYHETYDKLILSPGAAPIVPPIPGIELVKTFTVRNVVDIDTLNKFVKHLPEKEVAVIGGGFIGIEVAENLKHAGYQVTLIEAMNQILRPFDYDMVQILHKEIVDNGIRLILGDKVNQFEENIVVLASGKKVKAHAVVLAIGVAPETRLAKAAELTIGETGAIWTDDNYRTSNEDIYAVGDAIEVRNVLTGQPAKISLAGPALKQARAVAEHINGEHTKNKGYIASSAIQVFGYNGASTGLNEALIEFMKMDIQYDVVHLILSDKVGIMPDAAPMHFKLLFEKPTGRILGAQAIGRGDVTKRIDIIATMIKMNGTLEQLKDLELCYAPPFSTAKDIVNHAGYIGTNLLQGLFRQVRVDKVRGLVEQGEFIVDVREKYELEYGTIKGSISIPLSELRDRMSEIPKDRPVYLHCRTGQRSYNAVMALQNSGYDNVFNITGSFLGLSFYEYFNDQELKREPIVTNYNFN